MLPQEFQLYFNTDNFTSEQNSFKAVLQMIISV